MIRRLTILLFIFAIVAAACSSDDSADTSAPTTAAPTTAAPTTAAPTTAAPTTTPAEPVKFTGADGVESEITDTSAIVSLGGDITEIIYELGLGDNIVAIDVTTTFPEEATTKPVIGFGQMLAPEPVLAFSPTLVIGDQLTGPQEAIDQIRATGTPVVILESQTTLDGVATKIRQVAEILDAKDGGEDLAARVSGEIDDAVALGATAESTPKAAFIYIRGPQTVLLFGNHMPTHAMIEGANAVDVAAETGVQGAVPLTPEALAAAAPEVIVLPSGGLAQLGGVDALLQIPGIAQTPAGQSKSFLDYDEAFFFNFGPRTGEALKQFVLDLHPDVTG